MANDENFQDDEQPCGLDGLITLKSAGPDATGSSTARDESELHSNWSRWKDGSVRGTVVQVPWP